MFPENKARCFSDLSVLSIFFRRNTLDSSVTPFFIKNLLIKFGNIENDNNFQCTLCNNWTGKNKGSLGAHMRSCKFNNKNLEQKQFAETIVLDTSTPIITGDLTITPSKITKKTKPK